MTHAYCDHDGLESDVPSCNATFFYRDQNLPMSMLITITVTPEDEPRHIEIDAVVIGEWAAHPRRYKPGDEPDVPPWTVTHVSSGLALPLRTLDECDAINIAVRLGDLATPTVEAAQAFRREIAAICSEVLGFNVEAHHA